MCPIKTVAPAEMPPTIKMTSIQPSPFLKLNQSWTLNKLWKTRRPKTRLSSRCSQTLPWTGSSDYWTRIDYSARASRPNRANRSFRIRGNRRMQSSHQSNRSNKQIRNWLARSLDCWALKILTSSPRHAFRLTRTWQSSWTLTSGAASEKSLLVFLNSTRKLVVISMTGQPLPSMLTSILIS